MRDITAVIPFCSYDKKFFQPCIDNLLHMGIDVVVIVYDHLWGGDPENIQVLNDCQRLYSMYIDRPMVRMRHLEWKPGRASAYWESYAQFIGTHNSSTEYTLYIDIDEIPDPVAMSKWLDTGKYRKYICTNLNQYVYALKPEYRLDVRLCNTMLCRTEYARSLGFTGKLRSQFHNNDDVWSRRLAKLGLNSKFYRYTGTPFIHHYTHIRDVDVLRVKVANWSHNADNVDWMVELGDYLRIRNNRIGGYKFKTVPNYFNI